MLEVETSECRFDQVDIVNEVLVAAYGCKRHTSTLAERVRRSSH